MSEDISKQPIPAPRSDLPEALTDYTFTDYTAPHPYPWQMTVAGVLWLVLGVLMLSVVGVLTASTMIHAGGVNAGGQNRPAPSNGLLLWLGIMAFCSSGLLAYGVRSIRGTVRKLVVNVVSSIGLGLYEIGWVVYKGVVGQLNHPTMGVILLRSVEVLAGVLLLAAGILALLGRSQYEQWRKAQQPKTIQRS